MNKKAKCKKIFCLMGYSNCGKDTILKKVIAKEERIKNLVSYTTRPMRKNEVEGREYYFIDKEQFFKMDKDDDFIEKREYCTKVEQDGKIVDDIWYYGFSKDEIESYEYGICIIDANGFNVLRHLYGNNCVIPIYILVPYESLKERALARGDLEEEIVRRLDDDYEKFFNFRLKTVYDEVKNKDGMLDEAVKNVCDIIRKHIKDDEQIKCKNNRKK